MTHYVERSGVWYEHNPSGFGHQLGAQVTPEARYRCRVRILPEAMTLGQTLVSKWIDQAPKDASPIDPGDLQEVILTESELRRVEQHQVEPRPDAVKDAYELFQKSRQKIVDDWNEANPNAPRTWWNLQYSEAASRIPSSWAALFYNGHLRYPRPILHFEIVGQVPSLQEAFDAWDAKRNRNVRAALVGPLEDGGRVASLEAELAEVKELLRAQSEKRGPGRPRKG